MTEFKIKDIVSFQEKINGSIVDKIGIVTMISSQNNFLKVHILSENKMEITDEFYWKPPQSLKKEQIFVSENILNNPLYF